MVSKQVWPFQGVTLFSWVSPVYSGHGQVAEFMFAFLFFFLFLLFSCSVVSNSAAHQASLSITNSRNFLKFMSIESVMPSIHLILCRPLLFPLSIFPSIRVFPMSQFFTSRWPEYWNFSFLLLIYLLLQGVSATEPGKGKPLLLSHITSESLHGLFSLFSCLKGCLVHNCLLSVSLNLNFKSGDLGCPLPECSPAQHLEPCLAQYLKMV